MPQDPVPSSPTRRCLGALAQHFSVALSVIAVAALPLSGLAHLIEPADPLCRRPVRGVSRCLHARAEARPADRPHLAAVAGHPDSDAAVVLGHRPRRRRPAGAGPQPRSPSWSSSSTICSSAARLRHRVVRAGGRAADFSSFFRRHASSSATRSSRSAPRRACSPARSSSSSSGCCSAFDPATYRESIVVCVPLRRRAARPFRDGRDGPRTPALARRAGRAHADPGRRHLDRALSLSDLPGAFVLGVQAGVLNFIPYLGPIVAGIPIGLVAMPLGVPMLIWAVGIYTVIQTIEGYVVGPLIQRRAANDPAGLDAGRASSSRRPVRHARDRARHAADGDRPDRAMRFYVEDWLGDRGRRQPTSRPRIRSEARPVRSIAAVALEDPHRCREDRASCLCRGPGRCRRRSPPI